MYAFGLCVDERYLLPSLVTLSSLADSLTPAARREAAVRVLTLDLTPQHATTMADLVRRAGFGSFDLRWARPMRTALMADDDYITVTAYLRFNFTTVFVDRPYLIYIDADTLALDDMSLPLGRLRGNQLGLVADEFNPAIGQCKALPGLADDRPDLHGRPYFNSGVWWLPTTMLAPVRAGVRHALRSGGKYIFHNDQDALNLWLLDQDDVVQPVPGRFNRFELARFLERSNWTRRYTTRSPHATDTALLHFVGSAKPWLPNCPTTAEVSLYRSQLWRTLGHLDRLGDLSLHAPPFRTRP
ncbi:MULTISPECIES: glycosyltransferase family 8 protein [unclassified Streptomyces]|uniref:glycosyltransferase family 8 protein n=1 Tax=unclassified Streptomyces TaxID=2593676 RepID=UPI002E29333A|nr:glycosyltransferase [Streptomyces sp. NBC_00223]